MQKRLERVLRQAGVYAPMKSSFIYEAYLRVIRRDVLRDRSRQIEFYRSILRTSDREGAIFDIGANLGDKAEVFRRVPAKVICFEPDRTNIKFLQQRFRKRSEVLVVGKALSDKIDRLTFNVFEDGNAMNTLSAKWVDVLTRIDRPRFGTGRKIVERYEVDTLTLDHVLDQYGPALYVKIDVEGHEINVLSGLTRAVPFLSFEINLPDFRAEALACVAHLASIAPMTLFNYDVENKLEMSEWVNAKAFSSWLNETSIPYAEVWARTARTDNDKTVHRCKENDS